MRNILFLDSWKCGPGFHVSYFIMPLCRIFCQKKIWEKGNKLSRPRADAPLELGIPMYRWYFLFQKSLQRCNFSRRKLTFPRGSSPHMVQSESRPQLRTALKFAALQLHCFDVWRPPPRSQKEKKRGSSKNHRKYPKTQFIALNCTFSVAGAVPHTSRKSLPVPLRCGDLG